ncbi:hypothetical protein [Candidatus Ichthyocystis sparus]|uniref:hypothetical protein n=1 Tax=Candidatus Ichthyocystis sparus TaxID=1561004 RepID=UPI000B814EBF|nr:hypothetical protein [Candidatus Ichthyocystis sparus]
MWGVPLVKNNKYEIGWLSMSDKRIYGTSGSNSSSETDDPDNDESKSPLGAVGQDAGAAKSGEKSEKGSGGRSLASASGGSGLSHELGAKPKGRGGRGDPGKGKSDIWSNPARRSARSLKGRGQAMAAARGYPLTQEKEKPIVAVRVGGVGPRKVRGPGSDTPIIKKKEGRIEPTLSDMFPASLLAVLIFAVLVYDLLTLEGSGTASERDSNPVCGKITGFSRIHLAYAVPVLFMLMFLLSALFISIVSSEGSKRSKREDE